MVNRDDLYTLYKLQYKMVKRYKYYLKIEAVILQSK